METEKTCEFCTVVKPAVYCEADAAHLCLTCDAKVHSANALSNRHPRTLICEPCGYNLAYVRCSDHQMSMCRDCDRRHHDDHLSSQHHRKVITSYMGCPSAKDLAALWGFGFKDLEFISTSNNKTVNGANVTPKFAKRSAQGSSLSSELAESDAGSSGNHAKAFMHKRRENTCLILQQILDLERLELSEGSNNLTSRESQQNNFSSSKHGTSWNMHNKFDSLDLGPEIQDWSTTHENPGAESFPLPLPDGDSFWQCKSPVQTSQLWPQNLQDLGGYAELGRFDSFNMPDVDLTFQNFEELFGEDQDINNTMLNNDEEDLSCSSRENDSSIDRSDYSYIKKVEKISAASSICKGRSAQFPGTSIEHISTIKDCPPPIRTNLSTSRLSSESSGNDYVDSGLSSAASEHEVSCNSHDSNEILSARYNEKKKARLSVFRFEKQARNTPRRARTNLKKQPIKARILKAERYESDAINMSRSF